MGCEDIAERPQSESPEEENWVDRFVESYLENFNGIGKVRVDHFGVFDARQLAEGFSARGCEVTWDDDQQYFSVVC